MTRFFTFRYFLFSIKYFTFSKKAISVKNKIQPLRELATIGYLLRYDVTEINENLYRTDNLPSLRIADAKLLRNKNKFRMNFYFQLDFQRYVIYLKIKVLIERVGQLLTTLN